MSHEHAQHDAEAKQAILDNIEKYGCHLALLEGDNYLPPFVYSIGLFQKFGHPEIICFGLSSVNLMAEIINDICSQIKEGKQFASGKSYEDFLQDYPIQFIDVAAAHYANYVGYGGWYYGSFEFPVLQLVWPDKEHHFPWEPDFNPEWKFKQPLLDRNTDFKFYEERNLGVYTTKQAFAGEPILFVYHNDDGDWQFHTSSEPKQEDAILVCLEEITKLDPSINEIFHLQYGWSAWRDNINSEWEYAQDDEE